LVMRLRLCRVVEQMAAEFFSVEPSEAAGRLESCLNGQVSWLYQQPFQRRVAGRTVTLGVSDCLLSGDWKLILATPRNPASSDWDADVVSVVQPSRNDRTEALAGVEVNERIQILSSNHQPAASRTGQPVRAAVKPVKPRVGSVCERCGYVSRPVARFCESCGAPVVPLTAKEPSLTAGKPPLACPTCGASLLPNRGLYCAKCGVQLPAELAVRREVVVAVKGPVWDKLTAWDRQTVEAAWKLLRKGRRMEKVWMEHGEKKQGIFLFTVEDEQDASSVAVEQQLDEVLQNLGLGRVVTDPYELKQARRMIVGN